VILDSQDTNWLARNHSQLSRLGQMPGKVFRLLGLQGGAYGGSQLQDLGSDSLGNRSAGPLHGRKE
jgi:hypothetical protein